MTHKPTPAELDSFETRLLAELREHVMTLAPGQPALVAPDRPARQGRAWRGWAVAGAVAATVSTGGLALGLSGAGAGPAYAVSQDGRGDVTAHVRRLDDAEGLQNALREDGIDATVDYGDDPGRLGVTRSDPDAPGVLVASQNDCGPLSSGAATLTRDEDGWTLEIPADSPLQARPVHLGVDASGDLEVDYAGDSGGTCLLVALR